MIYSQPLDTVGRLLTLSIRGDRTSEETALLADLWRCVGADRAREAAQRNQVEALVGVGLSSGGIKLPPGWARFIRFNQERVISLIDALSRIVAGLEQKGVASAAIEAGGVLLGSDLPVAAYCSGDMDLLVAASGWGAVPAVFEAEGFVQKVRRGRPTCRREFVRMDPAVGELWFEVGCEPFDRMWVPLQFKDCSQAWMTRRVPARERPDISVLAPADALAFVAIHTSLHSYVRPPGLRLHVDVDRLVRDNEIDWGCFLDAIAESNAGRRAFVSLAMAAGLLGTPIPSDVLAALFPGAAVWSRIERLLSRASVIANGNSKLSCAQSLCLDRLLTEDTFLGWARSIAFPSLPWMREHFDREGRGYGACRLYARRLGMVARRRNRTSAMSK